MKLFRIIIMGLMSTMFMACDNAEAGVDVFQAANGENVEFHCIKHGSLYFTYKDKVFYFDPVGESQEPATDYSNFPKADYIFITHEHHDHLDPAAICQLYKPGCKIFINPAGADALRAALGEEALRNMLVITMEPVHRMSLEDEWQVCAVPAYNYSPEKLNFHPKGRDNGYIVSLDGFRIYVAGDTEDIPDMENYQDIDVAFLPCNLPYTMTPEQCANAARIIKPRFLFPYHYGNTEISRVEELLSDTDIEVRIRQYQ